MSSPYLTREILSIYEDRIMDSHPELDYEEALELARGLREEVDVFFGSGGYTVSLLKPLGFDSSTIFLHGYCCIFAHGLWEITGRDRFLLITLKDPKPGYSGWQGHVLGASDSEELWIDFNGLSSRQEIQKIYPLELYDYEVVDLHEFRNRTVGPEYRENPFDFLDELEIAFTRMVVEKVLQAL